MLLYDFIARSFTQRRLREYAQRVLQERAQSGYNICTVSKILFVEFHLKELFHRKVNFFSEIVLKKVCYEMLRDCILHIHELTFVWKEKYHN